MSAKQPDIWSQLIEEYSEREPDSPPLPPVVDKLLSIAYQIENDKKNGVDSNKLRATYFEEAGLLRGKGAPPKDESLLRVGIKKFSTYQHALLVMLEERGITTDEDTVKSVLATKPLYQDSPVHARFSQKKKPQSLFDNDDEEVETDVSTLAKNLCREHRDKSVVSTYEASKNIAAWISKERKSLENAHRNHREKIILSPHFHAYLRDNENTLKN